MQGAFTVKTVASSFIAFLVLVMIPLASAQIEVGDKLQMNANGLVSGGYAGDFGNQGQSEHGLDFGFSGDLSGSYFNPNFLSFNIVPYYNESRADSSYQSLTGSSGVVGSANFFTGSRFPGSISYHDNYNSTGIFGQADQPNFTTHGNGQGFGIGWSALLPGFPSLSAGFSEGSGSGSVYGSNQETTSDSKIFNLRSSYSIIGFRLNAYYDHDDFDNSFPEFLAGEPEAKSANSSQDVGFGATHNLPLNGSFYVNYNYLESATDYLGQPSTSSNYTTSTENSGATFHPLKPLSLFLNQTYTDNLAGYLNQNLVSSGAVQVPINLGAGSDSYTEGGGASYQLTRFLSTQAQATYYDQTYFGKSYSGTYITGTLNYARKLFDLFSFSAEVVENAAAQGGSTVGFVGAVNYFHRIKNWETSGAFTYANNVQSYLVTYTTSYYNYGGRVSRRFANNMTWLASFNGSHSGLSNQPGTGNHSESYTTSLASRRFNLTGLYAQSSGESVLTSTGLVIISPTPGVPVNSLILFNGSTYGGSVSTTPTRRLTMSESYNRGISNTNSSAAISRNNTEIFTAQIQYNLRRIGLLSGYTRLVQSISAGGAPPITANSYFIGVSRWFDFF